MSGIPAALAASLLWGVGDFTAGRLSRTHPVLLVALVGQVAGLLVLLAIAAFRGLNAGAFLPGALAGLAGVASVLSFYRALALGTMSVVAPIGATSVIVPVAWSVAEDQRPSALQWAGMVAALAGVALATREPGGGAPSRDARAALRLAVVAAITIGLSLVAFDKAGEHDALSGITAARVVSVTLLSTIALVQRPRTSARALPKLAAVGLLDTGANTAFAIATTGGLLALVAVLGGLYPIVTSALAYLLLGERLTRHQRIGVVIALIGIPLISAG